MPFEGQPASGTGTVGARRTVSGCGTEPLWQKALSSPPPSRPGIWNTEYGIQNAEARVVGRGVTQRPPHNPSHREYRSQRQMPFDGDALMSFLCAEEETHEASGKRAGNYGIQGQGGVDGVSHLRYCIASAGRRGWWVPPSPRLRWAGGERRNQRRRQTADHGPRESEVGATGEGGPPEPAAGFHRRGGAPRSRRNRQCQRGCCLILRDLR